VFDEDRYFEPAKEVVPFGFRGRKLGITICEDIWNDEDFWPERRYRRDPVKELVAAGADLILNLSASPWHAGKEQTRIAMLQRTARDEGVALLQVNAVGANDELIFDGHSVAINRSGELLVPHDEVVARVARLVRCRACGRTCDDVASIDTDDAHRFVVEFSSPNTNKPLHLGHIRNNLVGYSVAEILKAAGNKVLNVNLVNDRGIHICKSMLAWKKYGHGECNEHCPDRHLSDFAHISILDAPVQHP
jgi:hypothetical protein